MQTETTSRADLWILTVALYKMSLKSAEDISRWDRHAASFASHELEGDRQQIYRLLSLQLLKPAQEKNPARDYSNIKEILEEKYQ